MTLARHLAAVLMLPGVVTVAVPALIVGSAGANVTWLGLLAGGALVAVGLLLVVRTVALFASVGRGTLAPWDPTSRLVVRGPYRHVRNPMISGVLFILLGEAAALGSLGLLAWFATVFALNATYIPLVEEPGLVERFGQDYERYREHVPRWLPRLHAWTGEETTR
jgi:protein-S-isoprenylcysteine O-methyltransferase Ste14